MRQNYWKSNVDYRYKRSLMKTMVNCAHDHSPLGRNPGNERLPWINVSETEVTTTNQWSTTKPALSLRNTKKKCNMKSSNPYQLVCHLTVKNHPISHKRKTGQISAIDSTEQKKSKITLSFPTHKLSALISHAQYLLYHF